MKTIFFLFIAACSLVIVSADFNPQRLLIVDSKGDNYLIRGNLPIKNQQFEIKDLKRYLEKLTGLQSQSYRLVVYNLMNTLTAKQTKNKYIQDRFFAAHPQYVYKNNMVLGSFIDPDWIPSFLRNLIVPIYEYLSIDGMSNMLAEFKTYMKSQVPTIVYFHCSQGVDRTGYVASAYGMKYQNKTLKESYKQNMNVLQGVRKHMHFNTYQGIEWYCLYLGRSESECLQNLQE